MIKYNHKNLKRDFIFLCSCTIIKVFARNVRKGVTYEISFHSTIWRHMDEVRGPYQVVSIYKSQFDVWILRQSETGRLWPSGVTAYQSPLQLHNFSRLSIVTRRLCIFVLEVYAYDKTCSNDHQVWEMWSHPWDCSHHEKNRGERSSCQSFHLPLWRRGVHSWAGEEEAYKTCRERGKESRKAGQIRHRTT